MQELVKFYLRACAFCQLY